MHRGLVALSASAVAAIYMAGYLRTQAADASIGAADVAAAATTQPQAVAAAAPAPTSTPIPQVIVQPSSRGAAPAPTPIPTATPQRQQTQPTQQKQPTQQTQPAAQTQGAYKDGTYTGQGTSRRGDVWVNVQVQAGRLANVTLTRTTLQYPLSDIANLPSQVVQRQSAQVDVVSRATYSSMAFRGAVAQALAAAKAA